MAKGNMEQHRRKPLSRQTQDEADPDEQLEMEVFSLVQNSDYVPPKPKREPKSRAVEQDDTPLKSRIALGYLTVNGREEPVFAPIQGFEHLFVHEDVAAPRVTEAAHHSSLAASTKESHALKRRRTRNQDDNDTQDADEAHEPTAKVRPPQTFSIGDVESLQAFYAARFRELTMKPMRDVVTAWVKRLEPRRQKKYGPYQRYECNDDPDSRLERKKSTKPPWWPTAVPYVEPSHLKLQHLVPLAVDIMMVHRRIDEEAGKRKYPSWISKLETDATYLISSKDTEHFSSSRGARYNEAMKKRALEVILPSLFDVARSHEDYVAQYDLYENSGNEDPGCGKQVFWQATPRPERDIARKRPRQSRQSRQSRPSRPSHRPRKNDLYRDDVSMCEDDDDDTEVDEEVIEPSSTFSSFGSAFSYTEDVKMFPEAVPNDASQVTEAIASQPLYQTTTPKTDVTKASDVDYSMGRLQLYELDPSRAYPGFGFHTPATGVIPQCPTGLPFVYPSLAQAPFPLNGLDNFATCGPAVPHDVARDNAPETHLPSSSQSMHGLPMHHLPVHGLPTHGLSLITNWDNQY